MNQKRGTRHAAAAALLLALAAGPAAAAVPDPESFRAAAAVLVDAESGTVLFAKEPHRPWPPASMAKMMLVLIVLEQVAAGTRRLDEPVQVSERAEGTGGSAVRLKRGEVYPLADLLQAVTIASANDAAVAVAEHVGRSVEGFVDLMNARAEALGMKATRFATPHGLPAARSRARDVSSAMDMARLAAALVRHPLALRWASTRDAGFRQGKVTLRNQNPLLGTFAGADGLKTGHLREAGYNLAATAERAGLRLVAVVMGAPTEWNRSTEAARLLTWGFTGLRRHIAVRAGEEVTPVTVRGGVEPTVKLVTANRVTLFRALDDRARVERDVQVPPSVPAPVEAGQKVGVMAVKRSGEVLGQTDLVAAKSIPEAGFWQRVLFFWR